MFIGGVAVESYAPYRRTHDIDLAVRERDFPDLRTLLEGEGYSHRRSSHLDKHTFKSRDLGELDVYTSRIGDVPVEEALFERGREMDFCGIRLPTASLEDLLRLKLEAGREMDWADVAVLLHERGDEVDSKALEDLIRPEVLRKAAPSLPDLLPAEYGWQARQSLKVWLRQRGWLAR